MSLKGSCDFAPWGAMCLCKLLVACSYDEQFIISSRGWMHGLAVIHQQRHCLSMVMWRRDAFVTYLLGLLWSPVFPRGRSGKTRSVSANRQTASRAAQFRNGQASWMSSFSLSTSFNLQCVNGYLTSIGCTVSTFRRGWKWWPGIFPWLEWDVTNILKPFAFRMQESKSTMSV